MTEARRARPGYVSTRLGPDAVRITSGRNLEEVARQLGVHLPSDRHATILDLGAGTGLFLDYLAESGYSDYVGIDVDAESVAACADRHRVELVDDTRAYLESRPRHFDAIVMRQVISHLSRDDAVATLAAARRSLRPGGRILVQTFNAALPSAFYTFANDMTHRVAYTEHSLRQSLLLGGFSRVEILPLPVALTGMRRMLVAGARHTLMAGLRTRLTLERGKGNNPSIVTKEILAIGQDGGDTP